MARDQPAAGAVSSDRARAGWSWPAGPYPLFGKYELYLPLTRQSKTCAREGIELDVMTLADWVDASSVALMPLVEALRAYVLVAEHLHADSTAVLVLDVGRLERADYEPMFVMIGRSAACHEAA